MDPAIDNGTTSASRRRLPEREARAFRTVLLDAIDARDPMVACRPAIERVCAAARVAGLSATDLIVEVKGAWRDLPLTRRAPHQRPGGAAEQLVSRCIEEYYAAGQ